MRSSLGTVGKTKASLLGVKNYRIEFETLRTGWKPLVLQRNYIPFFFENFDFVVIWQKSSFYFFWVKNPKCKKVQDGQFVDLAIQCAIHILFALPLKLYFWWIFKHLPFINPKSREMTSQISACVKKSGGFWFFHE